MNFSRSVIGGLLLIVLIISGCKSLERSDAVVRSSEDYPERNQEAIVQAWGYPTEVILRQDAGKLGNNVLTWVYYLQDESGDVAPVFFNFRNGESLATNAFGDQTRRVLDVNNEDDLQLILRERGRIQHVWPIRE